MKSLQQAFAGGVGKGRGEGASVCVWREGRELACYVAGESAPGIAWGTETLAPIYSATKAPAAACLLLALYDCCQGPELEVGAIWPEFPAPRCTVGELLSHQAGLAALDAPASIFDLGACKAAIERTRPAWEPPQHGYHPHTFGPMLDILMLGLCGQRIGEFWERRVRDPLGLELYIGHVPQSAYPRIAALRAPRIHGAMPRSPFYDAFFTEGTPVWRAFHSVTGLGTAREMNTPAAWQCASPAKGGVASARGLAMFYQALLGRLPGSPFPPEVAEWMATPQCSGMDLTLMQPTAFACGAMCEPGELFGQGGFGHAGAGGAHAYCEPESGLSFAFVMNQMELGLLPGERVRRQLQALAADLL